MIKLLKTLIAALLVISIHSAGHAGVIGILTESTATGTFRDDVDGNPIIASFSGEQISESFGSNAFGSAAIFDSTSRLGADVIEFQNGNASYGNKVTSVSRTVVDISFENTSDTSVRPTLNSQITPAGLGMYVSGCAATDLRTCPLRDDGDYDWQDVGNLVEPGMAAVGTRFDFKVVSGEDVLFELSGGLELIIGGDDNPNTIVRDFGDIEGFLTNFRQTSPNGTEQQISFDWDATDFLVEFPEALTLDPGEIGTVSYITEVTTFSNAFCFDVGRVACPIAYGSFGDPIGRGGAAGPQDLNRLARLLANQADDGSQIDGLDIGLYEFNIPTFEDGQIGYRAVSGPGITSVNEPSVLALFMLGMTYLTVRRKRNSK